MSVKTRDKKTPTITTSATNATDEENKEKARIIVGERIRTFRKSMNLTQTEFGEPYGMSKMTLSRVENGLVRLTKANAEKISDIYGVGVDWVLHGDEERRDYPVNHKMIEWLWKHPEERKKLWRKVYKG